MYKIAVFTDIHANLQALEAIVNDINKKKFDEVICLGDVLSKGFNPNECMHLIINNNIKMVWGNHEGKAQELFAEIIPYREDRSGNLVWCMSKLDKKSIDFIMNLNYSFTRNIDGKSLFFTHYPFNKETMNFYHYTDLNKKIAEEYFKDYDYDYIFFGHHHTGKYYTLNNKRLYNLSSSGCVDDDRTFYYIINVKNGNVSIRKKYLKFDRKTLEKTIIESDSPNKKHLAKEFFGFNI